MQFYQKLNDLIELLFYGINIFRFEWVKKLKTGGLFSHDYRREFLF